MDFILALVIGGTLGWLVALLLRRVFWRKQWIEAGAEDARLPYTYRFQSDAGWIDKWYSEGYDAVINEKEDANA